MKKKRLTARIMTVCMAISVFTSSAMQVYAVENPPVLSTSFDSFVVSEFYSRGMNAAGNVLLKLGKVSDNDSFKDVTSFISQWVFGTSDASESFEEIQNLCNEILSSVNDIEDITQNVESLQNAEAIKDAAEDYYTAWDNQVDSVINACYSKSSTKNVYSAYEDYLAYSTGYKEIPSGKTLEDCEEDFERALINLCSLNSNRQFNDTDGDRNEFYRNVMYTTDVVDSIFSEKINTLLNNIEYNDKGTRYVDKAALYAYYAFPFSSEQAQFVDDAVEQQINQMTTFIMMYHDFLALRGKYYTELNEKQIDGYKSEAECDRKYQQYARLYAETIDTFEKEITEFMISPIHLKDGYIDAETTLDSYLREDSASTATNNNQNFKLICNNNYNPKITQTPSFYKNASVSISNKKLVFTPFYVLNGDVLSNDATNLASFNTKKERYIFNFYGPSYYFTTYGLSNDYNCLKNGVYSDGNNNYVAVSSTAQLKSLVNPIAYSANKHTPYTYFGDYLEYGKNSDLYLFLRKNPSDYQAYASSGYMLPVYNLKSDVSASADWSESSISQNYIKSEKYTAILTPQSTALKTTVNTQITGQGSVTVNGASECTLKSGETANISINAPQNHIITSVKVCYHGDVTNPSKVTSEKVISKDVFNNELELNFGVPYTNVTIAVETKEALPVDEQGNFIVNDVYNLAQMANMINSGCECFVNGNYVLTNNIYFQHWQHLSIGTDSVNFNGRFNGNGYTIFGMGASSELMASERTPLFNVLGENAVVENLNFRGADVSGINASLASTGVICRQNNGTIRNCEINDSYVSFNDEGFLGGVTGINNGIIENCSVTNLTLKRTGNTGTMGGITEINNGVVRNSTSVKCNFINGNSEQNSPLVVNGNPPESCLY